jgi:hypothetical protein
MNKISVSNFIRNYENGKYKSPDRETMITAGWHDWFCDDEELKLRLDTLFPKVYQIAQSSKINTNMTFVFFKNNCPMSGELYDDFRFCEMRTGDVVYTIIPASGQKSNFGHAELWGRENNFKEALAKGTWYDILNFFGINSNVMEYKNAKGNLRFLGKFGRSTQKQFDEALANIPVLVAKARKGDELAGQTANDLLWQLANESFSTRKSNVETFTVLHSFGQPENVRVSA